MLTSAPVVVLSCLAVALCAKMPQYEFVEEWNLWKGQHEKSYSSDLEDLDRHLVWLSNKKFIELHNANSHVFGYHLAMNHFGDLVSTDYNIASVIPHSQQFLPPHFCTNVKCLHLLVFLSSTLSSRLIWNGIISLGATWSLPSVLETTPRSMKQIPTSLIPSQ